MLDHPHECAEPPGEWIRIAAIRLALKYPNLEPCEAVRRAIDAFAVCAHLPPEEVTAVYRV
jgi:hypothetical protein